MDRQDRRSIALLVSYDGTDFAGSQRQVQARTVQGELETAICRVTGEDSDAIRLRSAGRTDAGVHAMGQVVTFSTLRDWPAAQWVKALGAVLPADVSVLRARAVAPEFDPRRQALSRSYRYQVLVQGARCPMRRRTFHRVDALPAEGSMVHAWKGLVGTHDFASFCSTGSSERSTIVTVTAADVERRGDERLLSITAISFLYHMVRRLVGAALAVGRGVLSPADFRRFLEEPGGSHPVAPTAPAHGLILTDVTYPAPWSWATSG